ncbi:MAG: tetratricopeptide repeat protein [Bacteroidota bacterium]
MSDNTKASTSSLIWRWGLIGLGLIVFLLLFFADKTNLTNENPSTVAGAAATTTNGGASAVPAASLPPLAPDPDLDRQIATLESVSEEEKLRLLDTIIVSLQARNRLAYAADYAMQLADLESSLNNQLRAGVLSQKASELSYVARDSSLMLKYSDQAVALLKQVNEQAPENEEALLHLGLALTKARAPMQGILTLRKLTELNPRNWEAQYRLGLFSLQTGQFEKALDRFSNVLKERPEMNEAKFQLAIAKARTGNENEAKELLNEVLQDKNASAELKQEANILLNQLK